MPGHTKERKFWQTGSFPSSSRFIFKRENIFIVNIPCAVVHFIPIFDARSLQCNWGRTNRCAFSDSAILSVFVRSQRCQKCLSSIALRFMHVVSWHFINHLWTYVTNIPSGKPLETRRRIVLETSVCGSNNGMPLVEMLYYYPSELRLAWV